LVSDVLPFEGKGERLPPHEQGHQKKISGMKCGTSKSASKSNLLGKSSHSENYHACPVKSLSPS
jgi:hypothetical protein